MPSTSDMRRRRNGNKEYRLRLLVLGERGLGKSTFLNNLCGKLIFSEQEKSNAVPDASQAHVSPDVNIITEQVELDDERTTPVDIILVPGCGDCIDNTSTPDKIKDYLDAQFDLVLNEELRIKRSRVESDSKAHVCIYFIRATSRGLRDFDIEVMKQLGDRVNIIPVIGKADMLTEKELQLNKQLIMRDINTHKINVFDFKNDKLQDSLLEVGSPLSSQCPDIYIREMLPFALICGNTEIISADGQKNHIRNYCWGQLLVEDSANSDFIFLKNILLGSHLQELKDVTNDVFYENYRTKMLLSKRFNTDYGPGFLDPAFPDSSGSIIGGKRRNAFSVSTSQKEDYIPFSKEMEEKNKIIKAYQQKIEALEKMLKSTSSDDPSPETCLESAI
ncbi:SPR28 (YDR218C) [Zygosaccharomyces parabailii]|nr:SPR28 (YDR218C) [Zygosaccharomyces parabailii]CDH09903.1 related to Sporulation-regulated protein 28 [Zygosaccharomyces bailii ISA1307]